MRPEVNTPEDFKLYASERKINLIPSLNGLEVGQEVKYTNEFGVSFSPRLIVGIDADDTFYGRRIYLAKDAYWFPVKPSELTLLS